MDLKNLKLKEPVKNPSKEARKFARKEHKMMNVIAKQMEVEISLVPTEWAVLWGPSLSMGTPKEDIKSMFQPPPVQIRQYENRMYSVLKFSSVANAEKAKTDMNGTDFKNSQTIYVGFLKSEPPEESRECLAPFLAESPPGLQIIPDFISPEEENAIFDCLVPKDLNELGQSLKRRWVRHFGFDFDYGTNNVDTTKPSSFPGIPDCVDPVLNRLCETQITTRKPEQITLNHYLAGQGIPPHVDTHSPFEEPILSLSLKGDVVMDFRDDAKHKAVLLPRRSLLVLTDEARLQWTHGIANRTFDVVPDDSGALTALPRETRVSLTFRLLRQNKMCNCRFPFMCDSQNGKITSENASKLEDYLVHKVYEDIAPHFSSTRHTPWPKIKEFVQSLDPCESLLDIGCGNGKYLSLRESCFEIGCDMSSGLLDICKTHKNTEVIKSNCLQLPFKDFCFDAVICIAVLHHLSTADRRLQGLREVLRVLRKGGLALIYVWAKNQETEEEKSVFATNQASKKVSTDSPQDVRPAVSSLKNYTFLPIHNREPDFPHSDMLVPWIKGSQATATEIHHRYYHVFDEGELERLILQVEPSPTILKSYYDQGNWCIEVQK